MWHWLNDGPAAWVIWVGAICGIAALSFEVLAVMTAVLRRTILPKFRLRQKVIKWLVRRRWVLSTEDSPSLHFGLGAADIDNPLKKMLISRSKNTSHLLTFSASVPFDPKWFPVLETFPERSKIALVQDLGIFIGTMKIGFEGLEWPLANFRLQTALPIDSNLSEHVVDLQGKELTHVILGARRIIRKAVTMSIPDKGDSLSESASE